MRPHPALWIYACVLVVCAVPGTICAQTNIPPAASDTQRNKAKTDFGEKAIETLPSAGLEAIGRDAAAEAVKRGIQARDFVRGAAEGTTGVLRETSKFATEEAVDILTGVARKAAVDYATGAGVAKEVASGAIGLSLATGTVIGAYIREEPAFGRMMGTSGSIGQVLDKQYFKMAPDSFKKAISGVDQVDFDSPEFQSKLAYDQEKRQREIQFERQLQANQQQRKAEQAYIAAQRADLDRGYAVQGMPADERVLAQTRQQSAAVNAQLTNQLNTMNAAIQRAQNLRQAASLQQATTGPSSASTGQRQCQTFVYEVSGGVTRPVCPR